MTSHDTYTFTLNRSLVEHPRAFHLRRMRTALWLYLALLMRRRDGAESVEVEVPTLAASLGLKEGTVRSWLGHLRRAGYIRVRRLNGSVVVTLPESAVTTPPSQDSPESFTVAHLERALGELGNSDALAAALRQHAPPLIQRALAGALAPPASEIRRSRTALFLFLLKRYDTSTPDNPRS